MREENKSKQQLIVAIASVIFIISISIFSTNMANAQQISTQSKTIYKVTFVELGSVKCIPCQKMQVVMKSIKEKYGKDVKIEFHDVWTPEGKPFAEQFKINLIPTQIFLDGNGKEFFRHEGYFSEEEVVKVLKTKGVK